LRPFPGIPYALALGPGILAIVEVIIDPFSNPCWLVHIEAGQLCCRIGCIPYPDNVVISTNTRSCGSKFGCVCPGNVTDFEASLVLFVKFGSDEVFDRIIDFKCARNCIIALAVGYEDAHYAVTIVRDGFFHHWCVSASK